MLHVILSSSQCGNLHICCCQDASVCPDHCLSAYHTLNHLFTKTVNVKYSLQVKKLKKTKKQKRSSCETSNSFSKWTKEFSFGHLGVFFHRRIFYVGKTLFICHCDSCEYELLALRCVVLSCVTAPWNSISLGRRLAAKSTAAAHKQLASSFYCRRYFDIDCYDRG